MNEGKSEYVCKVETFVMMSKVESSIMCWPSVTWHGPDKRWHTIHNIASCQQITITMLGWVNYLWICTRFIIIPLLTTTVQFNKSFMYSKTCAGCRLQSNFGLDFAHKNSKQTKKASAAKSLEKIGRSWQCLWQHGTRNACGVSSSNIADYRLLNAGEDLWRKGRVY